MARPMSNEDAVFEYFQLIEKNDLDSLLNLFADDAVIFEPFSKSEGGLKGRLAIEPFLKVVMMANENLRRKIAIEKQSNDGNTISALVTFEKGDKLQGRFTFEFDPNLNIDDKERKIKSLHIQFL
jgi:ketosteroid isomerase-like protein